MKSPNMCLYDERVMNAVYPKDLMSTVFEIDGNSQFYTIQKLGERHFSCLLCRIEIHQKQDVLHHVAGSKHTNNLTDINCILRVKRYHKEFTLLPAIYQSQQILFSPNIKVSLMTCKICSIDIRKGGLLTHITWYRHKQKLTNPKLYNYNFELIASSVSTSVDDSDDDSGEIPINTKVVVNTAMNSLTPLTPVKTENHQVENLTEKLTELKVDGNKNPGTSSNNRNENIISLLRSDLKQTLEKVQISVKPDKTPVKHNIIPSLKLKPENIFDKLENRLYRHIPFIKFFNDKSTCTLCDQVISPMTVDELKSHFRSINHNNKAKPHLNSQKYVFYCDLCTKKCYTENKWAEHLACIEHRQRITDVSKSVQLPRGGLFMEYECTTCHYVMFCNTTHVNKHLKEATLNEKKRKAKEIKLPLQAEQLLKSDEIFNREICKLNQESNAVLNEIDLSWQCCKAIEKALEGIYGQCKAYPFGSRVSGLGNLRSDLDVFVDTGFMYNGLIYQDADSQAKFVNQTARALMRHHDFADINKIARARTPIVQVFHKITKLDCDLSFRHGLSVENTEYLRLCIKIQPLLKPLILIMKRWSNLCKFDYYISTYAISMLAIFFMQVKGHIPSLTEIRKYDETVPIVIGGWLTCSFNVPIETLQSISTPCDLSCKDLLCLFFNFYGTFKFKTEVVCPLLGRTVLKCDFFEEKAKRLPIEMKQYVTKINESEENEVFRSMSPMCIQDPFDLSHNLTKACPGSIVDKFTTLCQMSHAILSKKE